MNSCCGINAFGCSDQFNLSITNNPEGITVNVTPKDKKKVEALQKMVEACRELCGEDCC